MFPSSELLTRVRDLYRRGLYVQAYDATKACGPIRKWGGSEARVLAARVAGQVGASTLRNALITLAWLSDRDNPFSTYYMGHVVRERRGLLEAWEWTSKRAEIPGASDTVRADWLALRANLAAHFRDFENAERLIRAALALAPDRPWVLVEHAGILRVQDRYEEALAAIRQAMAVRPDYVPGIGSAADLLVLIGREQEALEILRRGANAAESVHLFTQLGRLELDLGHPVEARAAFERALESGVLMESGLKAWLHTELCDVAHVLGESDPAARHAKASGLPLYEKYAERVAKAGPVARRVLLPVPFVRQHHVTCAPATLTALSRFWSKAADHLEVAERICYDGTPSHSERIWAESNGFAVREFTVTWDSSRQLIDRGIPFTLALSGPRYGHLQAIAGYDAGRRSFLVRDPSNPSLFEYEADAFLEGTRSSGPRGMALVPAERKPELDSVELPEAALYDHLHDVLRALDARDRESARRAVEAISASNNAHPLALWAARSLAAYDQDKVKYLAAVDALLALFPDDVPLLLARAASLKDLAREDERLRLLCARAAVPGAYPGFHKALADELVADARRYAEAERLLRHCLRRLPDHAEAYATLARIYWNRGERDRALELHRFASGLRDKDEDLAMGYFMASRATGRSEEAIGTLKARNERYSTKSSMPARTLYSALIVLDRVGEARDVLVEALRKHPDDGGLALLAAEAAARRGEFALAAELIERARGKCRSTDSLRTQSFVAAVQGNSTDALELWKRIVEEEPLDLDAHQEIVRLLKEAGQGTAAEAHLRGAVERFPHALGLQSMLVKFLEEAEPTGDQVEKALLRMRDLDPAAAWTHRELAVFLAKKGRIDESRAAAAEGIQLEPHAAVSHTVRAFVCRYAGDARGQVEAAREAVRLAVGSITALHDLIDGTPGLEGRRDAFAFILSEIERQAEPGEALLFYRMRGPEVLGRDQVLTGLRSIWTTRPDLWKSWEALVLQLAEDGKFDEAMGLGSQAADRFPLQPEVWLALARAGGLAGSPDTERTAFRKAQEMAPVLEEAALGLASAYRRGGEFDAEHAVLSAAVNRIPLSAVLHETLARCLWSLGRREEALQRAVRAVRLSPGLETSWDRIREWAGELGRSEEDVRVAKDLVQTRSGDARAWLALARLPRPPGAIDERLAATDRALALEPGHPDLLDLKAMLLGMAGRFDEAAAVCSDPRHQATPYLRGRALWLKARQGKKDEAIKGMVALLDTEPGYLWGWSFLYTMASGRDKELARKAAEEVVRLDPQNPSSLQILAEARAAVKNTEGAKSMFRATLNADPNAVSAALRLIDLHWADKEFEQAEAVIERLRGAELRPVVLERRVRMEILRGAKAKAAAHLASLVELMEGDSLTSAVEAFLEIGESRLAAESIERPILQGKAHPEAGWLWMKCVLRQERYGDARRGLRRFRPWPDLWQKAASQWLETTAEKGRTDRLRWFLFWNRKELKRGDLSWGSAGYALITRVSARAAWKWLRDWESRPRAPTWSLLNAAVALRILGRTAEAHRVSRAALERPPDTTTPMHRLWNAFDDALEGPVGRGTAELEAVEIEFLDPFWKFLRGLGRAVLKARSREGTAKERFRAARRMMALAVSEFGGAVKGGQAVRAYRRSVKAIARQRGGLIGWLWAFTRWATS